MASRARSIDRPIALLAAMAFITQLGVSVMLPLLPLYAQSMGATPFVLSLLVGGFAIALAIGQLASGFLAERFPSRRLVVTGIGLYAGANVAIAGAATAFQLIAFRAAAGLGSGINQVAERLNVTQVADRARLAFSNGILSAAGSAGSVLGPTFGGVLAAIGDLRVPFIVVGSRASPRRSAGGSCRCPRRGSLSRLVRPRWEDHDRGILVRPALRRDRWRPTRPRVRDHRRPVEPRNRHRLDRRCSALGAFRRCRAWNAGRGGDGGDRRPRAAGPPCRPSHRRGRTLTHWI
jgi:MFS family permease